MPHDNKGQLLKVGDKVKLTGSIISIDSEQPTFCNVQFLCDFGMEPGQDGTKNAPGYCLSARMTEKVPDSLGEGDSIVLDKSLRRDIDAIIQRLRQGADKNFTGERAPGIAVRSSRERSLALTKLQESVMWLGMDLKAINDENPQPPPSVRSLAIDAYTRYGVATGGKNFLGEPMPSFADLGETIQNAWEAAITTSTSGANPYPNSKDPSNKVIDKTADGLKL